MALLAVIYLYAVGLFILFWCRHTEYVEEERWALTGVAICILNLGLRLVYSLIFIGSGNTAFNAIKSNPTTYLTMTMLPGVAIIAVCSYIISMKFPLVPKDGRYVSQKASR